MPVLQRIARLPSYGFISRVHTTSYGAVSVADEVALPPKTSHEVPEASRTS